MVGKLICSIDEIYPRICLILCGKFEKIVRGGGVFLLPLKVLRDSDTEILIT